MLQQNSSRSNTRDMSWQVADNARRLSGISDGCNYYNTFKPWGPGARESADRRIQEELDLRNKRRREATRENKETEKTEKSAYERIHGHPRDRKVVKPTAMKKATASKATKATTKERMEPEPRERLSLAKMGLAVEVQEREERRIINATLEKKRAARVERKKAVEAERKRAVEAKKKSAVEAEKKRVVKAQPPPKAKPTVLQGLLAEIV
jgi:hypothetical protein